MRRGIPATIATQPSQIRPASIVKVIMPNQSKALAAPRRNDRVAGAASNISGGSNGRTLRLRGLEKALCAASRTINESSGMRVRGSCSLRRSRHKVHAARGSAGQANQLSSLREFHSE